MRSKIREGLSVLLDEGPATFFRESVSYIYGIVYWSIYDSYTLAIDDTKVSFTAPNRTVVQRNKRRFDSEGGELGDLLGEIESNDVFFDIGANTGLYSLFVAKRCSTTTVVAFEPYPPNVNLLNRDVSRNGLSNVEVRSEALSDSTGTVEFDQPEKTDIGYGSASIGTGSAKSHSTVEVAAKSGDELVSNDEVPMPTVIKIDVEGAEPLVIEGLKDTLSNADCRLVYCEIHQGNVEYRPSISDFEMTLADMKRRFEDFGFDVEELQARGTEVLLKMTK